MTESLTPLTLDDLLTACAPGGGTTLLSETALRPAGGEGAVVAPAKVLDSRNNATYAFERRMEEDAETSEMTPVWTVVIDSKQSVSNRDEASVVAARRDAETPEGRLLLRVPTVEVEYGNLTESDLTLPHRVFDGHIRAASLDGAPATQSEQYRALRDATKLNARALLEGAPTALVLGAWDATRKSHQGRYQTCLSGEVIGVLADQGQDPTNQVNRRAAGRVDPVAASVRPQPKTVERLVQDQSEELSEKLQKKILDEAKKKGASGSSMSTLGLGHIPPTLGELGGVSCRSITRRRVLSFAALRQLRFGGTTEQDVAARVLLAAYALLGMALSDRELYLRANCDLVEAAEPRVELDLRYGRTQELAPITVETAVNVFATALVHAEKTAGITWQGQVLRLVGDAEIIGAASADEVDEEK
ncbi:type I-U CRISPR-associated RAMP protein Csb1/Cas7u [Micrococcus terreus]|uniref:type I-G CRISPR-associated RAMP protein Csb1/Cas7g n=1 Tax=Micrococcus terreus TaxID=574650 RepID=UPI003016CE64